MSKEVEAAIKRIRNTIVYLGRKSGKTIYFEDINLIIEQAERVEELEEAIADYAYEIGKRKRALNKKNEQNKRYREALEFYADRDNYIPFDGIFLSSYQNKVDEDGGKKARQALGGAK